MSENAATRNVKWLCGCAEGLVIEPSRFSLMLRRSKGSIMEVVEVAKRDSVIGDGEESEWFWLWAEN
ncbi:hypothetical protein E5676_scaffold434G004190 [Cucumis melo var. makuwa]|uniref:Uncharacterized protein n=2 Tax=Cucumis melo TaxID=3656 RepID=A0A5D3D3K3_CUCMM|nr:hypothetical protein E6C27_scaffold171G002400 [Cucumis melo var. makuwa]TYK17549.1 hypothetical protein E5676_scaffold434G004190 [Cucumis melo var. makuwa]